MTQPFRVRNASRELDNSARALRGQQTKAEDVHSNELRGQRLVAVKVRRQHAVGGFVLDFYIPAAKVAIEVDGSIHDDAETKAQDDARTEIIGQYGIELIRFRNEEVLNELDSVLQRIKLVVEARIEAFGA